MGALLMELKNKPKETRQWRDWDARRACEKARELERAGDYEGARTALGKLWTKVGERPAVDNLPPDTQAEVLCRVGALSGWLGSANQIAGAQEFARDLLTESITLFETLDQSDKRTEAMGDLALCYWRAGAQDEGRALFRQAVDAAEKPETKLRTLTNASTVEISSGRYEDALGLLNMAAAFLEEVSDDWLHGAYHYQRGLVYKKLGGTENLDHALIEYSAASMHLAKAGHIRRLAGVENNIGFILLLLGRTAAALTHLDKARAIFVSLKDSGSVAQVNETRARVFLAEKRFAEAERAIFAAVTVLEQGDDASLLAEALTTEGRIYAGNGKHDSARKSFNRASEVAAAAGDSHLAAVAQLKMIEEIADVLSKAELLASYRSANQYAGDRASQSELEALRHCGDIVMDKLEQLESVEEELIGGTLKEEVNHFEARLIARALERHNGSIPGAARELGLSRQGLSAILDGRQSKTLARKPKRDRS
jgi:tetratricopeptide (TPR) repeat protein